MKTGFHMALGIVLMELIGGGLIAAGVRGLLDGAWVSDCFRQVRRRARLGLADAGMVMGLPAIRSVLTSSESGRTDIAPDCERSESNGGRSATDAGGGAAANVAPAVIDPRDPVLRIGMVGAARHVPTRVGPDDSVATARTIMSQENATHLPVMTGDRTVVGVLSVASIVSRQAIGEVGRKVRDWMVTRVKIQDFELPLDQAVEIVKRDGVVFVLAKNRKVQGVVTAKDLLGTVWSIVSPFLTVMEIERSLRCLVDDAHFTVEELAAAMHNSDRGREVVCVADLSFGEIVRLLDRPENWERVGLALDRVAFVRNLQRVNAVRNQVMHFRLDGPGDADRKTLKNTVELCRTILLVRGRTKRGMSETVAGTQEQRVAA